MFKILKLFTILLLFINCSNTPSYPKWYMKVYKNNSRYIYGTGEGKTKSEAVNKALNEIASKVKVFVESTSMTTTNISIIGDSEEYSKDATQIVKNRVDEIEFSNYKIEKSEQLSNGNFIVLVSVDKKLNAKLLLEKIDTAIKEYQQLLKSKDENPIAKLKKFKEAISKIENIDLPNCNIAKSLNPDIDVKSRISTLLNIKKSMLDYKSNITFSVVGEDNGYKKVLIEEITSKGFRVTNGSALITIYIDVKEKTLDVLDNKILKAKINLKIESKGKVVGQRQISIGAKSKTNYKLAREFTIKNFKKRLKNKKIIETLLGI